MQRVAIYTNAATFTATVKRVMTLVLCVPKDTYFPALTATLTE